MLNVQREKSQNLMTFVDGTDEDTAKLGLSLDSHCC